MTEIIPYIGTRYNPKWVKDLSKVVTPPYDVISPADQEAYYKRHEHNIIRLILGKKCPDDDEFNNCYSRAANLLAEWKSKGILTDEDKAGYYIYEQEYTPPGEKKRYKRRGFLGLLHLEPFKKGGVLAHERTFDGPKADRLKLLRAAQTNFSPIFMIYRDKEKKTDKLLEELTSDPPVVEFKTDYDNVTHRMWVMSDANHVQKLRALMDDMELMIADGHHRYETAVQYSQEMRSALPKSSSSGPHAFDYALVYCNNSEDEGMRILPYHRVLCNELDEDVEREEILEDLQEYYHVQAFEVDLSKIADAEKEIQNQLNRCTEKGPGLVMALPDGAAYALTLKDDVSVDDVIDQDVPDAIKKMPVSLVQHHLIPHVWIGNPEIELEENDVSFVNTIGQALTKLQKGQGCAAFLLNAVSIDDVFKVARMGYRMPQKSTYFYPKLVTGLTIRELRLRC